MSAAVKLVMEEKVDTTQPDEMLQAEFERLQEHGGRAMVVVRTGRALGLLRPQDIGEMLMMGNALRVLRAASGQ